MSKWGINFHLFFCLHPLAGIHAKLLFFLGWLIFWRHCRHKSLWRFDWNIFFLRSHEYPNSKNILGSFVKQTAKGWAICYLLGDWDECLRRIVLLMGWEAEQTSSWCLDSPTWWTFRPPVGFCCSAGRGQKTSNGCDPGFEFRPGLSPWNNNQTCCQHSQNII